MQGGKILCLMNPDSFILETIGKPIEVAFES